MAAPLPTDERHDHFAVRNGVRCAGVHLIIDLHGAERLNDIDHIEATLRRCVDAARATLLHIHLHHFQPNGVSGVAVLAESHISIHTWPDAGFAALDVFMQEPAKENPLFGTPNLICTPHLGYAERGSYEALYTLAVDQVLAYLEGKPINVANPEALAKR